MAAGNRIVFDGGIMMSSLVVIAVLVFCPGIKGVVQLRPLSTIYLPYIYEMQPEYDLDTNAAAQSSYDASRGLVYTVGYSGILHVIDVSDVENLNIVHKIEFDDEYKVMGTDVQACGDHVAITLQHKQILDEGFLHIYRFYNRSSQQMPRLREIKIGVFPAQLVFTKDCKTILTANEGRLTKHMHAYHDAEGTISIIKFLTADIGDVQYTLNTLNFTRFNVRKDEYVAKGVRYLYSGLDQTNYKSSFSQDMEPEYITLNKDETKAYISLQENNAIAVVDIGSETIQDIYPLGAKDWSKYKLDASDVDRRAELYSYKVYGMYQPDNIRYFMWDNEEYIVTANEGDAKAYRVDDHGVTWSESIRGKVFTTEQLIAQEVDNTLSDALRNKERLGNLLFSFKDGEIMESKMKKFNKFYTYGGRSFSIWHAANLSLVYDSGSEIEEHHTSSQYLNIFNSHVESPLHTPLDDKDTRSDDKGPEPETLEVVEISDSLYFFIGNERTSTIMIYSMERQSTVPKFESMYRSGFTNTTWRELYLNRQIGDIDPEDLLFISYDKSPNCRPLLMVTGSVSGTVSFYEVTGLAEPPNKKCLEVTPEPPFSPKPPHTGSPILTTTTRKLTTRRKTAPPSTTPRVARVIDRHDLVYIIDANTRVGQSSFNLVKKFITDSLVDVKIGREYTRVAIVTYSRTPHIQIPLNGFSDYMALVNATLNLIYDSAAGSDLASALNIVRKEVLSKISDADARKTVIVITNGKSDTDVKDEAEQLRAMGVVMAVLAVQSDTTSTTEFNDLKSTTEISIIVESFEHLSEAKNTLITTIRGSQTPLITNTVTSTSTSEASTVPAETLVTGSSQQTMVIAVSVVSVMVALAVAGAIIGFLYYRSHGDIRNIGPLGKNTTAVDKAYVTFENERSVSTGDPSPTS